MSVSIIYRDVDFQAKKDLENVQVYGDIRADYTDVSLLKFVANPPTRKATLEKDFWRLDGSYDIIDADETNYAVFSEGMSANTETANGFELSSAINVQYVFEQVRTISKLTFSFDAPDYCTHLIVEGYADKELTENVFQKVYYPNEPFYTCDLEGEFGVVALSFTFLAMNKPNRFFRLYGIDFGESYTFNDEDVYSVSVLEQTSLISQQLYIGTSDISLKSSSEIFKKYKPIFIYKNGKLEQTHFISNVDRSGFNRVELECADVLFLLNDFGYGEGIRQEEVYTKETDSGAVQLSSKFDDRSSVVNEMIGYEGAYNLDSTTQDFIQELQKGLLFKMYSVGNASNISVSGYYEGKNKKDLLNEVAFANQCSVRVTPVGQIKIYNDVSEIVKTIPQSRIFSNFSKKTAEKINALSLSVYSYSRTEKERSDTTSVSVTEDNPVFIKYARFPAGGGLGGKITIRIYSDYSFRVGFHNNNENFSPTGTVYYFTVSSSSTNETIYLEQIDANKKINLASISQTAFITVDNKDVLIDALSQYYSHNSTLDFDMVVEDEELGDFISVDVGGKIHIGRIEKMEYTMQGKKIASVTMRVYEEV